MIKADIFCIPLQEKVLKGRKANSFSPIKDSGESLLDGDIVYRNDLCYGNTYPNSFFDIWYPSRKQKPKETTVVFFHGGGFLFGDKVGGDPLAKGEDSSAAILKGLAENGYQVVSADYALAPEYRFPEQIRQANELLDFLLLHGQEYGLNMNRLVLMGSSAGANIVEILGTILTNQDYAQKLNITVAPGLKERICGIVVDESALDLTGMDQNMELLAGVWLGVEPVQGAVQTELMNAPIWIKEGYPQTFVTSSNVEPIFHINAIRLFEKCSQVGTPCTIFDANEYKEPLNHGFLTLYQSNPAAGECFRMLLDFLGEISEGYLK